MDYVAGNLDPESDFYVEGLFYNVASRSVKVRSYGASFCAARVSRGVVSSESQSFCWSQPNDAEDSGGSASW